MTKAEAIFVLEHIEAHNGLAKEAKLMAIKALKQSKRKKGEWEEKEVFNGSCIEQWQSARCSACGLFHTTPYGYYFNHFNFCPHCGAEMRKEETNDD